MSSKRSRHCLLLHVRRCGATTESLVPELSHTSQNVRMRGFVPPLFFLYTTPYVKAVTEIIFFSSGRRTLLPESRGSTCLRAPAINVEPEYNYITCLFRTARFLSAAQTKEASSQSCFLTRSFLVLQANLNAQELGRRGPMGACVEHALVTYKRRRRVRSNTNDLSLWFSSIRQVTRVFNIMKTLALLLLVALAMQVVVSTSTSTGGQLSVPSYSLGAILVFSASVEAEPKPGRNWWYRRRRRRRRSWR